MYYYMIRSMTFEYFFFVQNICSFFWLIKCFVFVRASCQFGLIECVQLIFFVYLLMFDGQSIWIAFLQNNLDGKFVYMFFSFIGCTNSVRVNWIDSFLCQDKSKHTHIHKFWLFSVLLNQNEDNMTIKQQKRFCDAVTIKKYKRSPQSSAATENWYGVYN